MPRGLARSAATIIFLDEPSSLDTSIRFNKGSVQYRLRAFQSIARLSGLLASRKGITFRTSKTEKYKLKKHRKSLTFYYLVSC